MKALACVLLLIIVYWAIFLVFRGNKNGKVALLDKQHTNILKGYALIAILFSHVGQFLGINAIEYPAGIGVSLFFILSAYGIVCSINKSGLQKYWRKRLLRVFLPYALVELSWLLIRHPQKTFLDIALDLTLIEPLYQFGWYLRYTLICYLLIWCVYKFIKSEKWRLTVLFSAFAVWFLIKSLLLIDPTPFLQARQMLCFPLGILLATFPKCKEWCEKRKVYVWAGTFVVALLVYLVLHTSLLGLETTPVIVYNTFALFTCFLGAFSVIGITYKLQFLQNKGMEILSPIAYEFYILHGYFITGIHKGNQLLNCIFFLIVSFIASIGLHFVLKAIIKTTASLWGKLKERKEKGEPVKDGGFDSDNINA